jgi:hypothetical protein
MRNAPSLIAALAVLLSAAAPAAAVARTFYVNPLTGSDAVFQGQAQQPTTPVKTVKRALRWAVAGDTVLVVVPSAPAAVALADTATIESRIDGTAGAPITIKCQVAGLCQWAPPAGTNGFFVSHNHHVLDGFAVVGGNMGIRWGAHEGGDGPLFGGVIQNNSVEDPANNGIQCANCQGVEIAFNTVSGAGQNGIRYQGNGGVIHDNASDANAQFGLYVVDGIDHQVWANAASGNGAGQIQILGALLLPQRTYYVGAAGGNDARTPDQAQSAATPWLTIQRALDQAQPGDTVLVLPGTYAGAESKRDGTADLPIVLRSSVPGGAAVQGGAGSGLLIGHHHHTVDGFEVTGFANGIQVGPHEVADGVVRGVVVQNCTVHGNAAAGIKFARAQRGKALHNRVSDNGAEGIVYRGNNARIVNNLVRGNGGAPTSGKYGIALTAGDGHEVTNNTVHGNTVGGLRLGTSNESPVTSTVRNNIVTGNPIGVKEPGGASYTGLAALDFNNVHGNTLADYDLGPSTAGPGSISLSPGYVDAAGLDFRLGRIATGQAADSPCIDRGSASADALGLAGRTAFTDKAPDEGPRVDLGYHGTVLVPSAGAVTVSALTMNFTPAVGGDTLSLSARLSPGDGSDGLGVGTDYVQVGIGTLFFTIPVTALAPQGADAWSVSGTPPVASGTLTRAGGAVDVVLTATGLNLTLADGPQAVQLRIGDDSGVATVPMRGSLVYP